MRNREQLFLLLPSSKPSSVWSFALNLSFEKILLVCIHCHPCKTGMEIGLEITIPEGFCSCYRAVL